MVNKYIIVHPPLSLSGTGCGVPELIQKCWRQFQSTHQLGMRPCKYRFTNAEEEEDLKESRVGAKAKISKNEKLHCGSDELERQCILKQNYFSKLKRRLA